MLYHVGGGDDASAVDLGQGTSSVRGVIIHLAIAAIFGIAFNLICRVIGQHRAIRRSGNVMIGLGYGLLLWSIAQIAVATGLNIGLGNLSTIHLAVAHVIYGVILGWLAGRVRAE